MNPKLKLHSQNNENRTVLNYKKDNHTESNYGKENSTDLNQRRENTRISPSDLIFPRVSPIPEKLRKHRERAEVMQSLTILPD